MVIPLQRTNNGEIPTTPMIPALEAPTPKSYGSWRSHKSHHPRISGPGQRSHRRWVTPSPHDQGGPRWCLSPRCHLMADDRSRGGHRFVIYTPMVEGPVDEVATSGEKIPGGFCYLATALSRGCWCVSAGRPTRRCPYRCKRLRVPPTSGERDVRLFLHSVLAAKRTNEPILCPRHHDVGMARIPARE